MRLIINHSIAPAFNLALEEYALTKMNMDIIMLWRNDASVIIGRNQNAVEEIDMDFVRERGIKVVRRLTGGGAVFHDLGNINCTIITGMGEDDFGNYYKFATPICDFLRELGVGASLKGRNDLVIGNAKFSGNAQTSKGNRIMHHGTILFDADISSLAGALKPGTAKIESKGVKSVRGRVTNVAEHLQYPMTVEVFFEKLVCFFRDRVDGQYHLANEDVKEVEQLVRDKYDTWEWTFGSSPKYSYSRMERFSFGSVDVRLLVKSGVILEAHAFGDFFGKRDIQELESRLVGVQHNKEAINKALELIDIGNYIQGITKDQFCGLF